MKAIKIIVFALFGYLLFSVIRFETRAENPPGTTPARMTKPVAPVDVELLPISALQRGTPTRVTVVIVPHVAAQSVSVRLIPTAGLRIEGDNPLRVDSLEASSRYLLSTVVVAEAEGIHHVGIQVTLSNGEMRQTRAVSFRIVSGQAGAVKKQVVRNAAGITEMPATETVLR